VPLEGTLFGTLDSFVMLEGTSFGTFYGQFFVLRRNIIWNIPWIVLCCQKENYLEHSMDSSLLSEGTLFGTFHG
jgi:hypothetical protein